MNKALFCGILLGLALPLGAMEVRIKDLCKLKGYRPNTLIGYGLVVGLNATGDTKKSLSTNQAMSRALSQLGIKVEPELTVNQNIASVMITAELKPFAKVGDHLAVHVSAIGDAKNLAGGVLIKSLLRANDGQVYAEAQGPLSMGLRAGEIVTSSFMPRGAIVEKELESTPISERDLRLSLNEPDFVSASRMTTAINRNFKGFYASAIDAGEVKVVLPEIYQTEPVKFLALLESIAVEVDQKATVVINEKTGTVVMGKDVQIDEVVISHGSLSVSISAATKGSQQKNQAINILKGSTVGELMKGLNALGAKPSDLVGILQAIKAQGALKAELKFL